MATLLSVLLIMSALTMILLFTSIFCNDYEYFVRVPIEAVYPCLNVSTCLISMFCFVFSLCFSFWWGRQECELSCCVELVLSVADGRFRTLDSLHCLSLS